MEKQSSGYSYGKRPLWQWIAIYAVIGLVVYGAIYYFVIAKQGGYSPAAQQTPQSAAPAAANTVQISNFNFSPATVTVKAGDTVTWTNNDSVEHSATADDSSFDTGLIGPGKSGTFTFAKAGTYTYHCQVHPTMKGTIIVQ